MNSLWGPAFIGLLAGALSMWLFRRITDRRALGEAVNRIQAYLLEFWLFVDDPSLIWKSWRGLLIANARLIRLLVVPIIVLSLPMVPLYYVLDSCFGYSPLQIGRPALVTIQLNDDLDPRSPLPALSAPAGIDIETAPVRVVSKRQVSWRLRPVDSVSGQLQCLVDGKQVEKRVSAGAGFRFLSLRRTGRILDLFRYPTEAPLQSGLIDWIEVSYPPATTPLFGMDVPWTAYFLFAFMLGAFFYPRHLTPKFKSFLQ